MKSEIDYLLFRTTILCSKNSKEMLKGPVNVWPVIMQHTIGIVLYHGDSLHARAMTARDDRDI